MSDSVVPGPKYKASAAWRKAYDSMVSVDATLTWSGFVGGVVHQLKNDPSSISKYPSLQTNYSRSTKGHTGSGTELMRLYLSQSPWVRRSKTYSKCEDIKARATCKSKVDPGLRGACDWNKVEHKCFRLSSNGNGNGNGNGHGNGNGNGNAPQPQGKQAPSRRKDVATQRVLVKIPPEYGNARLKQAFLQGAAVGIRTHTGRHNIHVQQAPRLQDDVRTKRVSNQSRHPSPASLPPHQTPRAQGSPLPNHSPSHNIGTQKRFQKTPAKLSLQSPRDPTMNVQNGPANLPHQHSRVQKSSKSQPAVSTNALDEYWEGVELYKNDILRELHYREPAWEAFTTKLPILFHYVDELKNDQHFDLLQKNENVSDAINRLIDGFLLFQLKNLKKGKLATEGYHHSFRGIKKTLTVVSKTDVELQSQLLQAWDNLFKPDLLGNVPQAGIIALNLAHIYLSEEDKSQQQQSGSSPLNEFIASGQDENHGPEPVLLQAIDTLVQARKQALMGVDASFSARRAAINTQYIEESRDLHSKQEKDQLLEQLKVKLNQLEKARKIEVTEITKFFEEEFAKIHNNPKTKEAIKKAAEERAAEKKAAEKIAAEKKAAEKIAAEKKQEARKRALSHAKIRYRDK